MALTERNNTSLLVKEEYKEFHEDVFILHSGQNIHEGKMIKIINGKIGPHGKHTSVYLDFGAPPGTLYRTEGHMYPEVQLGTHTLVMDQAVPASAQTDLSQMLPNPATRKSVSERIVEGTRVGLDLDDYLLSLQFHEDFLHTDSVVITHSHPDHDGNVALLNEELKIITSPQTHVLQELEQKYNPKNWMNNRAEYTVFENGIPTKEKRQRAYVDLDEGKDYRIGGEENYLASLIPVTHWPGSRAVEIQLPSGKRTLFTGDLNSGDNTEKLKWHLKNTPSLDLLWVDATHVHSKELHGMTEKELENEFTNRFIKGGPFYIAINERDLTRLNTIVSAAKIGDKEVYIPLPIAYYLKNLRDRIGQEHPELPDVSNIHIYLQPNKTGQYIPQDYSPIYRPILKDDSFSLVTQEDLHHSGKLARRGVIIFTHRQQLSKFSSRNLFGRGKRLFMSTFGNNPRNEFKNGNRWNDLNTTLNINNMSVESLNALHHMGIAEFEDFIRNNIDAEKVVVVPSRDPKIIKHLIESNSPHRNLTVLENIKYGQPYSFNGEPLKRRAVSYPGRSA